MFWGCFNGNSGSLSIRTLSIRPLSLKDHFTYLWCPLPCCMSRIRLKVCKASAACKPPTGCNPRSTGCNPRSPSLGALTMSGWGGGHGAVQQAGFSPQNPFQAAQAAAQAAQAADQAARLCRPLLWRWWHHHSFGFCWRWSAGQVCHNKLFQTCNMYDRVHACVGIMNFQAVNFFL